MDDLIWNEPWSVSKLNVIQECGKKYSYRYIDKIEEEPSIYFAFGRAVHEAIEKIGIRSSWAEEIWEDRWAEHSQLIDWTQYRKYIWDKSGRTMIQNYLKTSALLGGEVVASELEFPGEGNEFRLAGSYPMVGKIDQIRRVHDRLVVLDFKTSSREPDPYVLRNDPQFTTYWAYVREHFGEAPSVYWLHLKTGDLIQTDRTDRDVEILAEAMEEGKTKASLKLFARNVGFSCKTCTYKQHCLGQV